MELTLRQEQGLKIAVQRYLDGEKCTVISGYAGSGKSTLIRFIISALSSYGVDPELDVAYCAYTGKAAEVLRQKGNPNCKTAHKLLYKTKPLPNGKFTREPVESIDAKVVVVDECSMLPMDMTKLLLSYPVYVIFCGDPGQLPPIEKSQNNNLLYAPHIFLDEIMRQAQESGIIRLSMRIRNGESISGFKSDDAIVLPKKDFDPTMITWADQTLCATNKTRNQLNQIARQLRGYTKPIEEGEKLIVLRNNWDIMSDKGGYLTNGCVGTLNDFNYKAFYLPERFNSFGIPENRVGYLDGTFITDYGDTFDALHCDEQCITTGIPILDNKMKYKINKTKYKDMVPEELTYGYALTFWKAQGSEWSKVLALEEGFPFDKAEHRSAMYTACTRAGVKLVVLAD